MVSKSGKLRLPSFLLRLATRENQPTVKRSGSTLTAFTEFYPKIRGRPSHHVAESDLLLGEKSRQVHTVREVSFHDRRAIAFALTSVTCVSVIFFRHAVHLRTFAVTGFGRRALAFSRGGHDRTAWCRGSNESEFDLCRGCSRKLRPQESNGVSLRAGAIISGNLAEMLCCKIGMLGNNRSVDEPNLYFRIARWCVPSTKKA